MKEREAYEEIVIEIILFESEDVVTLSNGNEWEEAEVTKQP